MASKFEGFTCKDCANFVRNGESRSGTCKVRKYVRDKNSRRITNITLWCTFSKPACLDFAKMTDELKDSEPPKTYAELLAENAALRERLEKAVELKAKVGDTIYMPWIWNGNSGIAGIIVREIQIGGDGAKYYITSFTTDDLAFAARYKFGKFEEYYFGKMVFTTPEAAEVRLSELKGEKK